MNLYGNPVRAIAGQKYGLQDATESHLAAEDIEPGAALFGMVGDDRVFNAHNNVVSLTASADLVSGNRLSVKVNGTNVGAVVFDTGTDKTLSAVADAINADGTLSGAGIHAAAVAGARTLTIEAEGDIAAEIVVTGGESQAEFTATADTGMKFVGVARHEELSFGEGTGFYPKGISVNVLVRGEIYVPVADGADAQDGLARVEVRGMK